MPTSLGMITMRYLGAWAADIVAVNSRTAPKTNARSKLTMFAPAPRSCP
jgi:hypothetical protein